MRGQSYFIWYKGRKVLLCEVYNLTMKYFCCLQPHFRISQEKKWPQTIYECCMIARVYAFSLYGYRLYAFRLFILLPRYLALMKHTAFSEGELKKFKKNNNIFSLKYWMHKVYYIKVWMFFMDLFVHMIYIAKMFI